VIHRLLVDVGQQLVAILARRVSVYRIAAGGSPSIEPKLPCPSTKRVAQRELLHHADERLVHRRVAVRVVLPSTSPTTRADFL